MQGTEKQIAYATKMHPVAIRHMAEMAEAITETLAEGVDPRWEAHMPTLQALAAFVCKTAEDVKTTDSAAFILDHKDICMGGLIFNAGLRAQLPDDLYYVLSHIS